MRRLTEKYRTVYSQKYKKVADKNTHMFATEIEFKMPSLAELRSADDEEEMGDGDVDEKDEMKEDGTDELDDPDGLDEVKVKDDEDDALEE